VYTVFRTVYTVYRQCTLFTDSVHYLQTVYTIYRQCTLFTDSVHCLQHMALAPILTDFRSSPAPARGSCSRRASASSLTGARTSVTRAGLTDVGPLLWARAGLTMWASLIWAHTSVTRAHTSVTHRIERNDMNRGGALLNLRDIGGSQAASESRAGPC
jgi:hypothetical protein